MKPNTAIYLQAGPGPIWTDETYDEIRLSIDDALRDDDATGLVRCTSIAPDPDNQGSFIAAAGSFDAVMVACFFDVSNVPVERLLAGARS